MNSLKTSVDLFHFPHYNVPYFFSGHFVVTVHDLIHRLFPQYFGRVRVKMADIVLGRSLAGARRIIAVSQSTASDIKKAFPSAAHKVRLIYQYPSSFFMPQPSSETIAFKEKKGLFRYILYVGNRKPHKNIKRLLLAFQLLKHQVPNLQLVIIGSKFQANDDIQSMIQSLKIPDIFEVDACSDRELRSFYCGAEALVLPSLYEGFGLPPLEAMACGTPVCVSNAASLPEVVGSAGLYFDPGDPENMATVIHELLSNSTLRNGLKAAGLARVKLFTKDISAKETLRIYQEALTDMG